MEVWTWVRRYVINQRGAIIVRDPRAHQALQLLGGYTTVARDLEGAREPFLACYRVLERIDDQLTELSHALGGAVLDVRIRPRARAVRRCEDMIERVHVGFEVGTGNPMDIPLRHMVVTGQTQEAGKTTMEALHRARQPTRHRVPDQAG